MNCLLLSADPMAHRRPPTSCSTTCRRSSTYWPRTGRVHAAVAPGLRALTRTPNERSLLQRTAITTDKCPAAGRALMLRVTTLYAASAAATAAYYTQYLTAAPGEVPGVWAGRQAVGLGLSGEVEAMSLQTLLEGRDPHSGTPLGRSLVEPARCAGSRGQRPLGIDA